MSLCDIKVQGRHAYLIPGGQMRPLRTRTVRFEFRSENLTYGALISVAAWLALAGLAWFRVRSVPAA